jgi:peptide chain release factor 1
MRIPEQKLNDMAQEYERLKAEMSDLAVIKNQQKYKEISKRFTELNEIITLKNRIEELEKSISDSIAMKKKELDKEFLEMIEVEVKDLEGQLEKSVEELNNLLLPTDPNDDKNAIVEIRAGTGGDEAALFAADLFRMYGYYAERKKWKLTVLDSSPTELGGFKEIIFSLDGKEVYGNIRFESGVHRVQRVPDTESSGRIHTSAISVAVLPEAEEIDLQIDENDIRTDVYRSSGHGGQSVNTTDSAVRITHVPSGIVVTCQDEKSQLKNKVKAMKVLRAKLLDREIAKHEAEISSARKAQVGTGDRSAKIRTYNFAQNRVTDHRINLTSYRLEYILNGDIDEFVSSLKLAYKTELIES